MPVVRELTESYLLPERELDVVKTFECGQCFRWRPGEDGVYRGVAGGRAARVYPRGGDVYIEAEERDLPFWREYFDLGTDYAAARESVEVCDYIRECAAYGEGIRILRQDKWEALCSFIISQCNNIPRIRGIVERLCALFGEELDAPWGRVYAFPGPEKLAPLDEEALAPLRSGYRAKYILEAARAVDSGALDLEAVSLLPRAEDCRAALKRLPGVGDKVANCAVLFGLHRMDAFPIDVWVKKALREHMPAGFDPASLGEYAGLAQQYMFFRERERDKSG